MRVPVEIRTYKKSALATLVSLTGSVIDGLCKVLALIILFNMISEHGFFPGIIWGIIGFVVCVFFGAFIQALITRLANRIAVKKYERMMRRK